MSKHNKAAVAIQIATWLCIFAGGWVMYGVLTQ